MSLASLPTRSPSLGGLLLSGLAAAGVSSDVSRGVVHRLLADGLDPDIMAELNNLEIVIDEEGEKDGDEPPPPPPATPHQHQPAESA